MFKVNWAGAYEDFCRSDLSRAKYAASSRFQAFYAGRRPAYSTLCRHFKRLGREVPAEKASEVVPASTRMVSVTHLKAEDIRAALAAQPTASKVSPLRRSQANRAISIHLNNGARIEFASSSPELFALQALLAQMGGQP